MIVSSSNSKVLNVVCGCKVQALKKGKATITVTSAVNKKVKAVVKVTVKDGGDWIIGEGHILEDDEYIIDGKIVKLEDMLGKVEIIDGEEFVWAK